MKEQRCPPDYNGGFCDYDVDCKACWEQWEQEMSDITNGLGNHNVLRYEPIDTIEEYISIDDDGRVVIIQRSTITGKRTKRPLVVKDGKVYAGEEDER